MKKAAAIIVSVIILFTAGIIGYNAVMNSGKITNCKETIGESEAFSKKEIKEAMNTIKIKFLLGYEDCELVSLTYDEEFCKSEIERYLKTGKGAVNGASKENVIVISSDFLVGEEPSGDSGLTPGTSYKGWKWTLIRNSKNGKWVVDSWGFC